MVRFVCLAALFSLYTLDSFAVNDPDDLFELYNIKPDLPSPWWMDLFAAYGKVFIKCLVVGLVIFLLTFKTNKKKK